MSGMEWSGVEWNEVNELRSELGKVKEREIE